MQIRANHQFLFHAPFILNARNCHNLNDWVVSETLWWINLCFRIIKINFYSYK